MSFTEKWAKSYGGINYDEAYGIATDSTGNVYVTGSLESNMNFGSDTLTNNGSGAIFVLKLAQDGSELWAKSFDAIGYDYGQGIATDSAGNVYITGGFNGTINVGTDTLTSQAFDIFIIKSQLS